MPDAFKISCSPSSKILTNANYEAQISDVKEKISKEKGWEASQQKLIYSGVFHEPRRSCAICSHANQARFYKMRTLLNPIRSKRRGSSFAWSLRYDRNSLVCGKSNFSIAQGRPRRCIFVETSFYSSPSHCCNPRTSCSSNTVE